MRQMQQELVYFLLNGNAEAASEVYDQLRENRPDLVKGQLRRIEFQCEEISQALEYPIDLETCLSFVAEKRIQLADSSSSQ